MWNAAIVKRSALGDTEVKKHATEVSSQACPCNGGGKAAVHTVTDAKGGRNRHKVLEACTGEDAHLIQAWQNMHTRVLPREGEGPMHIAKMTHGPGTPGQHRAGRSTVNVDTFAKCDVAVDASTAAAAAAASGHDSRLAQQRPAVSLGSPTRTTAAHAPAPSPTLPAPAEPTSICTRHGEAVVAAAGRRNCSAGGPTAAGVSAVSAFVRVAGVDAWKATRRCLQIATIGGTGAADMLDTCVAQGSRTVKVRRHREANTGTVCVPILPRQPAAIGEPRYQHQTRRCRLVTRPDTSTTGHQHRWPQCRPHDHPRFLVGYMLLVQQRTGDRLHSTSYAQHQGQPQGGVLAIWGSSLPRGLPGRVASPTDCHSRSPRTRAWACQLQPPWPRWSHRRAATWCLRMPQPHEASPTSRVLCLHQHRPR